MGLEADCTVRHDGQVSRGKALLETKELIFRGEFRLKIPFAEIRSLETKGGELHVTSGAGAAVFELGTQAENGPSRSAIRKACWISSEPDSRVAVLGVRDEAFLADLVSRAPDAARGKPKKDSDLIFLAFDAPNALEQLGPLRGFLKPNGGIWVVYPKGRKDINEDLVRAAGRAAGMVDVKVAGFSDSYSTLKLVIPVNKRAKRAN
jgi:hypothetical protein